MEGHGHHHHQQQQHHHHPQHHHQKLQPQQQQIIANVVEASGDRFPQWSIHETKEFLVIRAELDQTFMETKRNKLLWEVIAAKMKEKGFNRSAEQCKCKWKNLVTRYKGCETMEPEVVRQQFPFYDDMKAIFTARMRRMLWAEAEGGGGASGSKKKGAGQLSSDEEDENERSEETMGDITQKGSVKRKLKRRKSTSGISSMSDNSNLGLKEVLEDFMKQQMKMEREWRESWEEREKERMAKEVEWRRKMEALENERAAMERRWREREEQWRVREEARAEKRDALITALLNKLTREGSST